MSNTGMYLIILTALIDVSFPSYRISVTISTSTFFDGLLVTGLYTSTSVQSSQSIGGSSAFGFGKLSGQKKPLHNCEHFMEL
jgi:hypothetical protein